MKQRLRIAAQQTTSSSSRSVGRFCRNYTSIKYLPFWICFFLCRSADRKKARNVKERWNEKRWIEMMKKKNNWLEVNIVAWQHLHDWCVVVNIWINCIYREIASTCLVFVVAIRQAIELSLGNVLFLWNDDTQTGVTLTFLSYFMIIFFLLKHFKVHCTTINKHSDCTFTTTTNDRHTIETAYVAYQQAGRQASKQILQMYTQKKIWEYLHSGNNSSFKSKTIYSYYELHFQFEQFICTQTCVRYTRTNAMHTQPRQSLAMRYKRLPLIFPLLTIERKWSTKPSLNLRNDIHL